MDQLRYKREIDSIANAVLALAITVHEDKDWKFQDLNSAIISVKGDIRYALEPIMARNKAGKEIDENPRIGHYAVDDDIADDFLRKLESRSKDVDTDLCGRARCGYRTDI